MNDVEKVLREYWFARRSIGHLLLDLSVAKTAMEQVYERLPGARLDEAGVRSRAAGSPVEHAAVIILDQHRAEIKSIEARLADERRTIERIERSVICSRLSEREREYIRLRYFENRSALSVCQRMYVSPATGGRIREAALKKLEEIAV